MKMKRQLSEVEKNVCLKKIGEMEKEEKWLEFQVKYTDLMLGEGLKVNFEQKKRELTLQRNEYKTQIEISVVTVKTLKKQIREGVEIKKKEKEVK